MADRVMAGSQPASASEPGGGQTLRAKANGGGGAGTMPLGAQQSSAVAALGSGEKMSAADRGFFEPRMGEDLSHVRLHRGHRAEEAAESIGARAFTMGRDIVLGAGEYGSDHASRHLLAHELAHVQQNRRGGDGVTLRMKACSDPLPSCDPAKLKKAQSKINQQSLAYKTWHYRATESSKAGCYRPEAMANALEKEDPGLFKGVPANYAADVIKFNSIDMSKIQPGDCFGFPSGWVDPKIGDIDTELANLNKTGNEAEKHKIVAAIYGEQSAQNEAGIKSAETAIVNQIAAFHSEPNLFKRFQIWFGFNKLQQDLKIAKRFDIQREYILYAMLLRIEGFEANWGPDFASVATPGTFHSLQKSSGTHKNNYIPAVEHLEGKTPKKPVNTEAIDRLKDVVTNAKKSSVPSDAGPYYFHWWKKSTAEKKYQELLKKKVPKDEAERKAAYHHAKTKLGAPLDGITETQGWLKKITGPNHGKPNERIGSMYIFR
ncbi:MAG: DUF4157 domain-containing protein [Pseudomonadota bacterium]